MSIKSITTIFALFITILNQYNEIETIDVEGNTYEQIEIKFKYNGIMDIRVSNNEKIPYVQILENRFKVSY